MVASRSSTPPRGCQRKFVGLMKFPAGRTAPGPKMKPPPGPGRLGPEGRGTAAGAPAASRGLRVDDLLVAGGGAQRPPHVGPDANADELDDAVGHQAVDALVVRALRPVDVARRVVP